MGTTKVTVHSKSVSPEEFMAGLTNFSGDRRQVWALNHTDFYNLHDSGPDWADVTEGSHLFFGDIWQRYRYDWSKPDVIRLDVSESNLFGKGSFWQYNLTPEGEFGCRVDLEVFRVPISAKARFFDAGMSLIAGPMFRRDLEKTFRAIEARAT